MVFVRFRTHFVLPLKEEKGFVNDGSGFLVSDFVRRMRKGFFETSAHSGEPAGHNLSRQRYASGYFETNNIPIYDYIDLWTSTSALG